MEQVLPTTPFGRRPLSLAMLAAQAAAKACPPETTAHKWKLFRAITEAKDVLGLSDRALAVLSALLSFHQETALTVGPDLIVFPSNRELSLRAHGIAPATLRRHLAALIEAGLIIRRDSPNGKRYARKGQGGAIEAIFGFDLSPLVARSAEFERLAEEVRAERQACMRLREQITILRRDIGKMITAGIEAGIEGPWSEFMTRLAALQQALPRMIALAALESLVAELRVLRDDVDKLLSDNDIFENTSANESQAERQHQNSNPDHLHESEPGFQESRGARAEPASEPTERPARSYPLGMVLEACPDITLYARHGISSWRDFVATADLVRSTLGISPDAWRQACDTLGENDAGVVVAAILQRADAIKSPGGYLRSLTEKARAGQFSLGPVLMSLLRTRHRERGDRSEVRSMPP